MLFGLPSGLLETHTVLPVVNKLPLASNIICSDYILVTEDGGPFSDFERYCFHAAPHSISCGWHGLKILPPLLRPHVLPKGLQGWLSGKKYV